MTLAGYRKQGAALLAASGILADNVSAAYLQGEVLALFEQLRKRVLNLDASVREEIKRYYIAYKTTTNFVDVEVQKKRLRLMLNMPFAEINDPLGLCHDVTGLGRWGNGDVEVQLSVPEQLDNVLALIAQSFERQREDSGL